MLWSAVFSPENFSKRFILIHSSLCSIRTVNISVDVVIILHTSAHICINTRVKINKTQACMTEC